MCSVLRPPGPLPPHRDVHCIHCCIHCCVHCGGVGISASLLCPFLAGMEPFPRGQKQLRELRVRGFVQQVFVELFVKAGLKIVKCYSSELQHLSDAAVRMELRLCLWSWKLAVKLDPMCCWLLTVLSILALTQTGWFGDRTAGDVVSPRGSSSRAVLGTSRRALTSRGGCAHQAVEWPKAFVLCGALPALPIHFLSLMAEDVHLNICSLLKWVGFVPFKRVPCILPVGNRMAVGGPARVPAVVLRSVCSMAAVQPSCVREPPCSQSCSLEHPNGCCFPGAAPVSAQMDAMHHCPSCSRGWGSPIAVLGRLCLCWAELWGH